VCEHRRVCERRRGREGDEGIDVAINCSFCLNPNLILLFVATLIACVPLLSRLMECRVEGILRAGI